MIYSSRSATDEGRTAMLAWLIEQRRKWRDKGGMHETRTRRSASSLPAKSSAAWLTNIDDRAVRFDGDWSALCLVPKHASRVQAVECQPPTVQPLKNRGANEISKSSLLLAHPGVRSVNDHIRPRVAV